MSMHNDPAPDIDLRGLKLAFLDALEQGVNPADWLRRYPQHATALTDLALAATTPGGDPPASIVARAAQIARAAWQAQSGPVAGAEPTLGDRVKALGLNMRD